MYEDLIENGPLILGVTAILALIMAVMMRGKVPEEGPAAEEQVLWTPGSIGH